MDEASPKDSKSSASCISAADDAGNDTCGDAGKDGCGDDCGNDDAFCSVGLCKDIWCNCDDNDDEDTSWDRVDCGVRILLLLLFLLLLSL